MEKKHRHALPNRLIAVVLTFAMIVSVLTGVMPGTGMTAEAETGNVTIRLNQDGVKEYRDSGGHFKVTNDSNMRNNSDGMGADKNGITITSLNGEWITSVVLQISSGDTTYADASTPKVNPTTATKSWSSKNKTYTITNINAQSFNVIIETGAYVVRVDPVAIFYSTTPPVTKVELNKSSETIRVDDATELKATITPSGADKNVKWSVNNTGVKLYSDAACTKAVGTAATTTLTVYAKGATVGTSIVTVTSNENSNLKATCNVQVKPAKPDPTVSNFTFAGPANPVYDGTAKSATVGVASGVTGMGNITVKYYLDAACQTQEVQAKNVKNAGFYYVAIDVAEGESYNAATLKDTNWYFQICIGSAEIISFRHGNCHGQVLQ